MIHSHEGVGQVPIALRSTANPSKASHLLAVDGPDLGAAPGLELRPEPPRVAEGGEPVHLAVVAAIQLVEAQAPLDLQVLRKRSSRRHVCYETWNFVYAGEDAFMHARMRAAHQLLPRASGSP